MKILGVLPLAGSGIRLGADFHKALMPFPSGDGLGFQPIVRFSIDRLNRIADRIVAVVSEESVHKFPSERFDLITLEKTNQGEAPSSVKFAAEYASSNGYSHLAVSLPDTFWEPLDGFESLKNYMLANTVRDLDGVLGLFEGDLRMLDEVQLGDDQIVTGISTRASGDSDPRFGWGWGCFILSVPKALLFSDEDSWATNLLKARISGLGLSSKYHDIGSPARYLNALKDVLD